MPPLSRRSHQGNFATSWPPEELAATLRSHCLFSKKRDRPKTKTQVLGVDEMKGAGLQLTVCGCMFLPGSQVLRLAGGALVGGEPGAEPGRWLL